MGLLLADPYLPYFIRASIFWKALISTEFPQKAITLDSAVETSRPRAKVDGVDFVDTARHSRNQRTEAIECKKRRCGDKGR